MAHSNTAKTLVEVNLVSTLGNYFTYNGDRDESDSEGSYTDPDDKATDAMIVAVTEFLANARSLEFINVDDNRGVCH